MATAVRAHGLVAVPLDAGGYRWSVDGDEYRWVQDAEGGQLYGVDAGKLTQLGSFGKVELAMGFTRETVSIDEVEDEK